MRLPRVTPPILVAHEFGAVLGMAAQAGDRVRDVERGHAPAMALGERFEGLRGAPILAAGFAGVLAETKEVAHLISGAILRVPPFPMGATEHLVRLRLARRHRWRRGGEILSRGVCFGL